MSSTITYTCPFCQARVEIAQELTGDTVDCPTCGQTFQAALPVAQPTTSADDDPFARLAPRRQVVATPAVDEHDLKVIHPTMFRAHPIQFVLCLLLMAGGIVVAVAPAVVERTVMEGHLGQIAGLVLAVVGGGYLLIWWLSSLATTLTVTNKRAILRRGIIARSTTEVQHEDIRNLQVHQGILQRILDVGHLAISSSGQDELEIQIHDIPDPDGVAAIIRARQ